MLVCNTPKSLFFFFNNLIVKKKVENPSPKDLKSGVCMCVCVWRGGGGQVQDFCKASISNPDFNVKLKCWIEYLRLHHWREDTWGERCFF